MPIYDILMLTVLVGTTLFGLWKGMAWQIASLSSLVLSCYAGLKFSPQLAPMFGDHAPWNRVIAILVIYIVTSFVIWMLFRLVSNLIDKVRLESFDRQLGGLFGLAKGVLLCVVITFFAVTLLPPAQGEAIVSSRSGRYIVVLLNKTHTIVPPEIHEVIDPYLEKIEDRLNPTHNVDWPANHPTRPTSQPTAAPEGNRPQVEWPDSAQPQPAGPLPAWPSPTQSADETAPYRAPPPPPSEPRPFASPRAAERAASEQF